MCVFPITPWRKYDSQRPLFGGDFLGQILAADSLPGAFLHSRKSIESCHVSGCHVFFSVPKTGQSACPFLGFWGIPLKFVPCEDFFCFFCAVSLLSGVSLANQTKKRAGSEKFMNLTFLVTSSVLPWENKHNSHRILVRETFMNRPFPFFWFGLPERLLILQGI